MMLTDPQDLFLRDLSNIYAAEQLLATRLPALATELENDTAVQILSDHALETEQHIKNLERVFKVLGMKPEPMTSPVVAAILAERDRFVRDTDPSARIRTMFDLDTIAGIEHFEIASYRSLVHKAVVLCEIDCMELLQENLVHEEATLRRVEELSRAFVRESMDPLVV